MVGGILLAHVVLVCPQSYYKTMSQIEERRSQGNLENGQASLVT